MSGAYGLMDHAKPGLVNGLQRDVRTLAVQEDNSFDFGDPIFVRTGDEENAYVANNADATLHFAGVAILSHRSTKDSQDEYSEFDAMNCLVGGEVWVKVPSNLTNVANTPAYVIDDPTDDHYGMFTNVEGTNFPSSARFVSNPITVGDDTLALIRVAGVHDDAAAT